MKTKTTVLAAGVIVVGTLYLVGRCETNDEMNDAHMPSLSTSTAQTGPADDDAAFVTDLQGRGITLPANVKPGVLGATICVVMRGKGMIETAADLMDNGFQGATFTGKQAGDTVYLAHLHYCPDQSVGRSD